MRVVLDANIPIDAESARALVLDALPDVDLSPDPSDNPILAAAIVGKADLIVSGDKKHVLSVGSVRGIPVVTARQAIERVLAPSDPRRS